MERDDNPDTLHDAREPFDFGRAIGLDPDPRERDDSKREHVRQQRAWREIRSRHFTDSPRP